MRVTSEYCDTLCAVGWQCGVIVWKLVGSFSQVHGNLNNAFRMFSQLATLNDAMSSFSIFSNQ